MKEVMVIIDKEFGEIKVRRSKLARTAKVSIGVDGALRASIPYYSAEFAVKRLIEQNREQIRQMLTERNQRNLYRDSQQIGKSHTLIFRKKSGGFSNSRRSFRSPTSASARVSPLGELKEDVSFDAPEIKIEANQIIVFSNNFESPLTQTEIRKTVAKILRKQAKAYLPRRVKFLAEKHGFTFERLKFSHTNTRWGSCSSRGTISLNIALMNLPFELIDYVIIHELCHTRQMNHSSAFWAEVEKYYPDYHQLVKQMKNFSPEI